jgi:hypothetical protein
MKIAKFYFVLPLALLLRRFLARVYGRTSGVVGVSSTPLVIAAARVGGDGGGGGEYVLLLPIA